MNEIIPQSFIELLSIMQSGKVFALRGVENNKLYRVVRIADDEIEMTRNAKPVVIARYGENHEHFNQANHFVVLFQS